MKQIELFGKNGKGKFMIVDDEDFDRLSQYKWYLSTQGYAMTMIHVSGSHSKNNIIQKSLVAHRFILNLSNNKETGINLVVDHKNHNILDNQKCNLRVTDYKGNSANVRRKQNGKTIGVQIETKNCYRAIIAREIIGHYKTEKMAALARDQEARKRYGEFAELNYPEISDYSEVIKTPPHNKYERTSNVRGVSYSHCRRAKNKWRAVKNCNHLGWFLTEEEAINAITRYENENKKENNP